MVRAPCCEKMGLKKGPWTPEEDQILTSFIKDHGHGNWRALPKQAGLLRCGKSCRLRWINYLRPDIKRGNFSREEEDTIIKLHEMLGNRWSAIAARLPGRTDNEIKNVWHTHLKKRLNKNINNGHDGEIILIQTSSIASTIEIDQSEPMTSNMSLQSSSSDLTSLTEASSFGFDHEINKNYDHDEDAIIIKEEINDMEFDQFPESTNYFEEIDESFWSDPFLTPENSDDLRESIQYSQDIQFHEDYLISNGIEHDMNFWFDVFIKAGGSPELPEV